MFPALSYVPDGTMGSPWPFEELVFPSQRIICGKTIPCILLKKVQDWDFAGGPVVKTPSNAGAVDFIPGRGTEVPHASWPK